ncbi:MAG: nuclease [Lachnospiraceae bacterium]|nr:nuclease [Lachnospiraceae bacterium]
MVINLDVAELEKQHQEDLQRIRGFRLIDDDFMNACFDGYIEGTELLLRIILNKQDIHVKKVTTQKIMKNLLGRDVWLDIDADDNSGREYDIEVQRADRGADRKRARYHSSILDAHLLQPKEDFSRLPETFVIFITENDVIGKGKPLYRIERRIEETDEPFDDGEHIMYVNGADKNTSTELGKLMHDFFCTNADEMHYKELADKVRYFKEDEKGVKSMCKVLEDMRNETAKQVMVNNIQNLMKNLKLSVEQAMEALSVPQTQREMYAGIVEKKAL